MAFDNRKTEQATDITAAFQEATARHTRTMARYGTGNENAPKENYKRPDSTPATFPPAPPAMQANLGAHPQKLIYVDLSTAEPVASTRKLRSAPPSA